jgi:hypothetical protein
MITFKPLALQNAMGSTACARARDDIPSPAAATNAPAVVAANNTFIDDVANSDRFIPAS